MTGDAELVVRGVSEGEGVDGGVGFEIAGCRLATDNCAFASISGTPWLHFTGSVWWMYMLSLVAGSTLQAYERVIEPVYPEEPLKESSYTGPEKPFVPSHIVLSSTRSSAESDLVTPLCVPVIFRV